MAELKQIRTEKRSLKIGQHRTSISVEDAFWECMKEIAAGRGVALQALVSEIDASRTRGNLSSAVRLFVLAHYQKRQPDRASPG